MSEKNSPSKSRPPHFDPTPKPTPQPPLKPLRHGALEPDLNRDEFEPRLPTRPFKGQQSVIGYAKSFTRANQAGSRPMSRWQHGTRGLSHGPRSYPQRVVVKARVVKGKGKPATERMRKHRAYLARSGTGLTGSRPEFFDVAGYRSQEQLHEQSVTWINDPHHFRFIISPEQGARLDLEDYVRSVMHAVSADLKTKLEWYGVCHHNTDNAHAHVVLRGVDDQGQPLVISRDYLSHGFRQVAEREASIRLGLRDQSDLERGIAQVVFEERFTFIDREFVQARDQSGEGVVRLEPLEPDSREVLHKSRMNKLKRLAFLESRGLAKEQRAGVWKIDNNLETVLRELSHRRAVERLVAPLVAGREEARQGLIIHHENQEFAGEVVGKVIAKDLVDELQDKMFLLLSGTDGNNHFIPLGPFSEPVGFESRAGQIVRVVGQQQSAVRAEEVIHRYLGEKAGEFGVERFTAHVKGQVQAGTWKLPADLTVEEYVERFVARCQSLERAGIVQRAGYNEQRWNIPADVVQKARDLDAVVGKKLKVSVLAESYYPLEEEVQLKGASWLDRIISDDNLTRNASGVLGQEIQRARRARTAVLQTRGVIQKHDTYTELLRRDERALMARLQAQHRKICVELLDKGQQVQGAVSSYELLSDGYRMVIRTEQGLVVRKVSKREARLARNTPVVLTVVIGKEQRKPFIRVRPLQDSVGQHRERRR